MSQYYSLHHVCLREDSTTRVNGVYSDSCLGGVDCPCLPNPMPPEPLPVLTITDPAEGQTVTAPDAVRGTAIPCACIIVYLDNTLLGQTTANECGDWSLSIGSTLPSGSHTLRAITCDPCCCPVIVERTFTVTGGTTLPAPVITSPINGAIVTTSLPTITGTATAGNSVYVCIDGVDCRTVSATLPSGSWSTTATIPLANGVHTVTAYQTDGLGNTSSTAQNIFTVNVSTR